MQANLVRLVDLTAELRRALKPLGKQAEIARRAQVVQAELRDARLRLHAEDLVTLRDELAREEADEAAAWARRTEVEAALRAARSEQAALEAELADASPRLTRAQEVWYRLSALEERLRGTGRLAAERARHLSAPPEQPRPGRDPDELDREAAAAAVEEAELQAIVERDRAALSAALARRAELEDAVAEAERAHLTAVRAVADRREGLATLAGHVEGLRSVAGAAAEEIERLSAALAEAADRAAAAQRAFDELQRQIGALDDGEVGLDARHEAAAVAHRQATERVDELTAAHREADRDRASWAARVEALSLGLARKDGSQALLAAGPALPGLLGSVAALLTVRPGAEAAVAAALGAAADAVVVSAVDDAAAALELLRDRDAGRAGLLVRGPLQRHRGAACDRTGWPALGDGARWALDLIEAPEPLRPALHRLLDRVAVVDGLAAARALVARYPEVRAVTRDGDVLDADWAFGGAGRSQSVIEVQAALDEAEDSLAETESRLERLAAALDGARAEQAARAEDAENTLTARHESDAKRSAVAEQLGRLGQAARSAAAEADRARRAREAVEIRRDQALGRLAELEERLRLDRDEPVDAEPDPAERDEAAAALATARAEELEARLALRTAEERSRALHGRAESLRCSAAAEREARARAEATRLARARAAGMARRVGAACETALERITGSLQRAVAERDAAQTERAERAAAARRLRETEGELTGELEKLTDAVHRDEVLRAQQRIRLEQLETRIADEFGIGLDDLVAEYGPQVGVPPGAGEVAEYESARDRGEDVRAPQPVSYQRAAQQRRVQRAERDLALLGKVNPLALEEFAALEERHRFLSTQLEDLKATRTDLLTVVAEVDEKIREIFTAAYHDVAAEFGTVFAALFPGGEGRLVLTEPDDMLSTGIEVEARPPGKKIKRLSLLSGGEKALTAVAMLVAIFRARPSPFYVLDEVEAALDDTNLRRLLGLLAQLRESSQLIVITHQKPTMEVADALYGMSMRGDGITTVVSQRLRGLSAGADGAA